MTEQARDHSGISASQMRLVIGASSAGTVFEWYDFFIYGTLAGIIGKEFFPAGNETLQLLLVWAGFAVGFGFRPLGAVLFGFLGDRLGRKYTFLVTVVLMGIATAGVGLIPPAAKIGMVAPALVLLLRILQGLALGGEYGGAAIYVSEHSAPNRRGFFTSFIQSSVVGGFALSLVVVLVCKGAFPADVWKSWAWRVPFVLSLALLAISLWMRLKLSESPVFRAMQAEGEIAGNPFVESMTYPRNKRRILVALFGISAGMTVIWYTSMFSVLSFLKGPMRVDDTAAEILVGLAAVLGVGFYVLFGSLSDRIGRKKPIMAGYIALLLLVFPIFHGIGAVANPALVMAARTVPVMVSGPDCTYNPFDSEQKSDCGKVLADLTALGVGYERADAAVFAVTVKGAPLDLSAYPFADKAARGKMLQGWLTQAGYDFAKVKPDFTQSVKIILLNMALVAMAGAAFGPLAALLCEMFPPRIRYSSMSIPYHIGTGYFGGFLPLIASYISARNGDPYSGLWYTWGVVLLALVVAGFGIRESERFEN